MFTRELRGKGQQGMSNELKYWPIEFLLAGKEDYYPGVCQGTEPQDAIKTFLENYSPSMGIIVAIRVPDVGADGKLIQPGHLRNKGES
jgi:hypothetical protein